jgi:hypothetical protein
VNTEQGAAAVLPLPTHPHVARIPQHALQVLGHQPTSQPSPGVLLGSLDRRLTEALVQAGATQPAASVSSGDRSPARSRGSTSQSR